MGDFGCVRSVCTLSAGRDRKKELVDPVEDSLLIKLVIYVKYLIISVFNKSV